MKKFDFKLQKLLEIRQKKEDEAKVELARASGEYQLEVNKKDKILSTVKSYRKKILSKSGAIDPIQLHGFDAYVKNSDLAVESLEPVIEEKRKVMQKELDKYSALKKDRRAVEIIKEKKWAEYQEKERKEEQAELDEIGQNVFRKNREDDRARGRKR